MHYSESRITSSMNRQQRRKAEREGKRLVKKHESVSLLARQDAINTMCVGEFDTEFHRVLANIRLDYEEGKISKEQYEKLITEYVK